MQLPARRLLALALLLAAVAAVAVLLKGRLGPGESRPAAGKPIPRGERSVLLVTVDTTRADHLQPYGAEEIATPTFQRLAREGVLFEHAYATAPITLVAHTSILTGLYPPEHGVRNNGSHYVPPEVETLAERLAAEGYRTGAFVSAAVLEKRYGLDQGFEVYDDDLSKGRERHPRMVADRPAEAVVDSARAWLDGIEDGERFFAWVHFYDPHAAYSPPPPYRDRYRERLYDGEIAYMDAEIGRLLEHPRLAAEEDVVVSVIGDHGESLGEHGEQTHAILAYDSTLRVPWLLRAPGGPRGYVHKLPVSQVDLVPTFLDLLGFRAPEGVSGKSLVPDLERGERPQPAALYSETYLPYYTYGWAKLRVLRRGSWKYIDAPEPELYDLGRDPRELSNLHGQQPGLAHDLARDLREMLGRAGDPEREVSLALDAEAAEKLRSLGYLAVGTASPEDGERQDPKEVIDLHVGLERARHLMRDKLFEQAVRQLRQVLDRDPTNLAAMIDLATSLDAGGEADEAVRVLDRALALDPRYAQLYLQLAGVESRRGDHARAIELVELALEIEPRSLEARIQKALAQRHLGSGAEAEATLAEALAEHPDDPRLNAAYSQLVELPAGRLEEAQGRLRKALDRDPFLVAGYRLLGDALDRAGRPSEAVEVFSRGLQRQPDDPELHGRLGLLLARVSGGAETEVHLREALRLQSTFRPDLHVSLGGWLAEHGRLAEAKAEYDKVLAREPGHPGARNNRAIALYRTGEPEAALAELEALVEQYPRHADAHNNLAAIAVEGRDWAKAERHARLAVAGNRAMPEAWNNLGIALEELDRQQEAAKAYDEALAIEPLYWQARFNRSVLLRKRGEPAAAAAALEEVVQQVPGYADSHLELGLLFAGPLADPGKARTHLNAFLRAAPQHPRAEVARRELAKIAGS